VPICRAAFGGLEFERARALFPAMEMRPENSRPRLHVPRWLREVLLAIVLTVAALAVITVTLWRGDGGNQSTVPLARKQ
jgi:hypothetical protein